MRLANTAKFRAVALKVGGAIAPVFLIAVGLLHSMLPKTVALDWQTVTLLVVGVLTLFLPMRKLAGMIKSLEIGDFKVELREESKKLTDTVTEAERDEAKIESERVDDAAGKLGTVLAEQDGQTQEQTVTTEEGAKANAKKSLKRPRYYIEDFEDASFLRYQVDQLTAIDPKAGLIRLASSIEQLVVNLGTYYKPDNLQRVTSFRMALDVLLRSGRIPPSLCEALAKFWRLRNKLVHVSAEVGDDVVRSAVDDGFRLVAILENISKDVIAEEDMDTRD
jgi:uncharacterized protein YutE (UPF0331/DUF86 family)